MFDIGGWELLVIAALALIVVGPKDLPKLVRSVGRWVAKARSLAREFQSGMEEAAREADFEEIRRVTDVQSNLDREFREMDREIDRDVRRDPAQQPARPSAAPSAGRGPEPARRSGDDDVLGAFEDGMRGREDRG